MLQNEEFELSKLKEEIKKLKTGRIAQLILIIIAIIGVGFNFGSYLNEKNDISLTEKKQEAEMQIKLMSFYLENYNQFLSKKEIERKNIFTILIAIDSTFDNKYTKKFFKVLKQIADTNVINTINEVESKTKIRLKPKNENSAKKTVYIENKSSYWNNSKIKDITVNGKSIIFKPIKTNSRVITYTTTQSQLDTIIITNINEVKSKPIHCNSNTDTIKF